MNSFQFFENQKFLHFVNGGIDLRPRNKKVNYSLTIENLLNICDRTFISLNDFSKTEFKNFLVGRTVVGGISFSL